MTKAVEAPSDIRTDRNRSADEGRAVDYRKEAEKLAAEDYQARIRGFHSRKASHPIARWAARM